MIEITDEVYLSEVVKWAEVFDEIIPDNESSSNIVTDRLRMMLDSSVSDRNVSKKILQDLIKEY